MVTRVQPARWLRLVAGIALPLIATVVQAQTLTATVDRDSVRENESFNYTLRAEGAFSGRLDLSPLGQDFDVLDTYRSSRVQIFNGRQSQMTEWTVSLMPREAGNFELPAIEMDGVRSNAVAVEVLPAAAGGERTGDIFIEVELDRSSAYVQSQVVYTLKLYIGVGTGPASLTVPLVEGGEAIVERLGQDSEYRTFRDGTEFNVRERRFAIFPQTPGTLSIGPVVYEGSVQQSRGFPRTVRVRSDVVELEVRPAVAPPPEFPNAVWLPTTQLELAESWSDNGAEFEQGVPQTRTLTVSASGLLETQLPELTLTAAPALRQYPDQPDMRRDVTADGIVAERTERFAVIAQQAGTIELPPVELPWWNIDAERWDVARIDGRMINVRAGQSVTPQAAPDSPAVQTVTTIQADPGWWPWLSAALAAGWLATIVAWAFTRRGRARPEPAARPARQTSIRQVLKQLVAACRVNDARRTRELLLDWAARQFADDPPRSLGTLAGRLSGPLADEVSLLEGALYGAAGAEWRGQRLADLLLKTQSIRKQDPGDDQDPLVPLYR